MSALALLLAVAGPSLALEAEQERSSAPPIAPSPSKPRHVNRLARETSPYLLLHAHNPVDWYPWGSEAFAKAKAEGKLIFLSVGYSSCYWCHVMERESFMDDEVAAFLNEHFVCIKVDREERPDIDAIYMRALQVYYQLAGSPQGGGWPLTMFLTPTAEPILGGTYFPPRDREDFTGLLTVLRRVDELWREQKQRLEQGGQQLARIVREDLRRRPVFGAAAVDETTLADVAEALAEQYDAAHGGFGYSEANPRQPKFPEPSNLRFLLGRATRRGDESSKAMLVNTLDKMARGGIRDFVGGGFHRYSTDRFWRIPHFEKMLYDNAQLLSLYSEGHRLTGRDDFRRVAVEIADFVLAELTDPQGAFYSAMDAETEAREGAYYVWQREKLKQSLGPDDFQLFGEMYGWLGEANFEGHIALVLSQSPDELAAAHGLTVEEVDSRLSAVHAKLRALRAARPRPLVDTKILTSWNGLMIRGLADSGRILGEDRYLQAAAKAADFLWANSRSSEGRLLRTYRQGEARLNAYLDDYAFFADGLIALYDATKDDRWLARADELTAKALSLFWDDEHGGFYFTSDDHEALIARSKDPVDAEIPSGNSVMAGNLVTLGRALDKPEYLERARRTVGAFAGLMQESPASMPRMAVSVAALLEAPASRPASP